MTDPISDKARKDRTSSRPVVAMLGSLPPIRGLSSYCLELSMAVARLTQVCFLSFDKIYPGFLYPGGSLKEDGSFPKIQHRQLQVRRRLTWYNPLTWIIEGFFTQADILHAQWWSMPLFPIYLCISVGFRIRNKPVIFTVHNVLDHNRSKQFTLLSRLLFRIGTFFIVHSGQNKKQMIEQYQISADRIAVIPHGPLDFHAAGNWTRDQARRKLRIEPDEKMILLFGAIRPYKGMTTALTAFKKVCAHIPEARLVIAGKPWGDWEPYQRQIADLQIRERVDTYPGYVPAEDVALYFMAADLVLLPYHHFDSQSGVGAIAVSFRKPLIVSNTGGLPELVRNPANVVPPRDPDALALAVTDCLKKPARLKAMEQDAKVVADRIAWPAIAKKLVAIYKKQLPG